ncbi:MAG: 16S rRNA (adenine(1518)-N(6)/adenine(1519)-N(6))-dimethyltransferase, partial [Clostridiales bacterium]|nr:16S rRNA (adenine(1518)-N(6)/adenine(1519)-N(6))-dimethyltransferase [Clostridiales bacterium]
MNREEVISILSTNEILPANKFGQNFLCDEDIIDRILEVSGITEEDKVLEIGPGIGALTRKLSEMGTELTAVEID